MRWLLAHVMQLAWTRVGRLALALSRGCWRQAAVWQRRALASRAPSAKGHR